MEWDAVRDPGFRKATGKELVDWLLKRAYKSRTEIAQINEDMEDVMKRIEEGEL